MWTVNLQMLKLVLEKAEEPEIKLPTSIGSSKKWESFRKSSTSALLTRPKPLTVWIITNCGKFWKRWEYLITWPASWEIRMQVKKQQLTLDMEQQIGSQRQASLNFLAAVTICSDFGAQENKIYHCFHFSPSICHEMMGPDAMILVFQWWVLSQLLHSSLSPSSRGSLVPLHFLPLEWCHLHIWGSWYCS